MAASPGPYGYPNPGSRPPQPPGRRPAARRRVGWLVLAALACLFIVVAVTLNPKSAGAKHPVQAPTPTPRSTVAQAVRQATLRCQARAQRRRPRDRTTVRIRVRTAARAQVTAISRRTPLRQHASGRASAAGTWSMRFRVGDARPGARIVIAVRVSRHGHAATCRASLRPRRIAVVATRPHPRSTASAAPPPPSPSPASCYPLSDEGTCYEPGEYCRDSDHGASGVAGDGERIVCEDNDGWRWEPV
jgi:hypothetical protein